MCDLYKLFSYEDKNISKTSNLQVAKKAQKLITDLKQLKKYYFASLKNTLAA